MQGLARSSKASVDCRLQQLVDAAAGEYRTIFDAVPTLAAQAPGRINLIGEHTDYSEGLVLPMAIDRWCVAVGSLASVAAGASSTHRIHSTAMGQTIELPAATAPGALASRRLIDAIEELPRGHWCRYPAGVLAVIARERQANEVMPAMNIVVHSDVPPGAGLSSSAALETAVATLALGLLGHPRPFSPPKLAAIGRAAEREFAHVPCGIMDQLISAAARENQALLIDCRSQLCTPVRLPDPSSLAIVAIDSCVPHALGSGEYAKRVEWCERAARGLGVGTLRDATKRHISEHLRATRKGEDQRLDQDAICAARHVVGENQRVDDAMRAFGTRTARQIGRLFNASHESLHTLYRVTCPETDWLARAARGIRGVYGSRMTGGGFGGCVIVLCRPASVHRLHTHLAPRYRRRFGLRCQFHALRPVGGAGVLELLEHGCSGL